MISVHNLVKAFPQKGGTTFYAVNDVSFSADDGEIVCLLGVNGAGKTTTMRVLSTVFKATSGTAEIQGWDIKTHPQQVRNNLGFLTGDTGLYNRLRVHEFIRYFGRLYSMKDEAITRSMNEMAELLDMKDFMDKKIEFLSTGMKQKVSIVRSIIHDPPVMIFDEPTAGLDILTARNIISFIRTCKERGKCVLFSTHIMREAERLADRIVMIHKGRILAEGSLDALREETSQTDLDDIFVFYVNQYTEGAKVEAHEF
ncbi:MAG: ATP-binding cassette domain-containing protein [Candidatus Cloacimonetes bacterium]|jgi:sodium transport system ATP-binding protein|nr:ATP-binding cassette domain-containing protein [Candidatus Cloacimonadota bacterium]MCB5287206.1 ATP-binding cassette domain-containing protein [Candidatus Cloacimonadota bacterium]MCK9184494.1 ATP-binding cassette domain-containing protein [Candidatus Cloacimonadota bacterium]MCK9583316.1 ATP-binding cassette domain-containing protein [Candidatus Cloacimonadota bacterium]MDY0229527.1 ATP-binding cassette domain-containing protein [Candidatus Cloacimonadaceae bacterium]